ncbi:MAG: Tyrosine recombinase XerC [Chlorobi bacterium]|nr:MAG: site-specific integrase [Bacteroidota bacterium]MBV6464264.1 Tyrosine recombinase XerC [Chlorobiota bacterium]WKZ77328.1 MAG: tyrosine-type recombinase/integrase [Candidatus Kapabacteria bacterium]
MRITFYLDKPQAARTSVMLNVAVAGHRLRFSTGVSLEPKHWNVDRQEPRSTDPHVNVHSKRLKAIEQFVVDLFHSQPTSRARKSLDAVQFKEKIAAYLTPEEHRSGSEGLERDFERFIKTYTLRSSTGMITSKRPNERTIMMYQLTLTSMREWAKSKRKSLHYDRVDLDFYTDYTSWLASTRNLTDSTVANYIKVIKTFMKWARQQGLHNSTTYESFYRDSRYGDTIALSVDEIRTIRDLDLTEKPRLARVRDHFLLQVYTGMRYGDLCRLEPRHFDEGAGIIRFVTQKTDTKCIIPITRPLATLLERYPSRLFEFASDVKQNQYLKELGKLAGFDQPVTVSSYRGGQRVEEVKAKHELLTTHVARRSFASTSIRFGVPESVIGMVTGHSAKGMLQQHYIRLDEDAIRDIVTKAWDQL